MILSVDGGVCVQRKKNCMEEDMKTYSSIFEIYGLRRVTWNARYHTCNTIINKGVITSGLGVYRFLHLLNHSRWYVYWQKQNKTKNEWLPNIFFLRKPCMVITQTTINWLQVTFFFSLTATNTWFLLKHFFMLLEKDFELRIFRCGCVSINWWSFQLNY